VATCSSSIAALLDFATLFVYAREEGDALNMADMFLRSIGEVAFALKQFLNVHGPADYGGARTCSFRFPV